MILNRYYLLHRPAMPGTVPGKSSEVVNFDERKHVPGVGLCWGYVEYDKPLDYGVQKNYELKQLNMSQDELKEFCKNKDAGGSVTAQRDNRKLLFLRLEQGAYGDRIYYFCEEDGKVYTDWFSIGD